MYACTAVCALVSSVGTHTSVYCILTLSYVYVDYLHMCHCVFMYVFYACVQQLWLANEILLD